MTALFTLKVASRRGMTLGFLFNDEKQGRRNYAALMNAMTGAGLADDRGLGDSAVSQYIEVIDNYGTTGVIDTRDISFLWFTEVGTEIEGQAESQMLAAHGQARLNRKVAADPLLAQAMSGQGRILKPAN